jgi:flagellar motor switch protein FliN/FliY
MIDDPPTEATGPAEGAASDAGEAASPFASLEMQAEAENGALPPPAGDAAAGNGADPARLDLVYEVPVRLSVELGRTEILIRDVVNLGRGSIIELDRGPGAPLDVRVNGILIGRGEVVLVNEERLGLRFVEVISQPERGKRTG